MTGHIRQRSPGSFEIRYALGTDPATGKRKMATATVRGTRKDADKELRRLLSQVDRGEAFEPAKVPMRDWFARWLRMVKPEISPLTYINYAQAVRLHLVPSLGDVPLGKLSPAHIQACYSSLAETGRLAASTRRLIHHTLSAALARAVEFELIGRNPALVLRRRLPRDDRNKTMATLTPEQSRDLIDQLRGTHLYAPVLFALATGCRRGEALALVWASVDLDRGNVTISAGARQIGRTVTLAGTKSGKTRIITLPGFAVAELRGWRIEQAEQLLRLGVRQSAQTSVCTRADGATLTPDEITGQFGRLAKRLGLGIHFHSLRHTHASQLLLAGVHPKIAQERMGHSSVAFTLDRYAHAVEQLHEDAAARIDAALARR